MVTVMLDEVATTTVEKLHLPMPADERLRDIVSEMLAAPSERGNMASWAARAGMSERSFARVVARETGMSFGQWRTIAG